LAYTILSAIQPLVLMSFFYTICFTAIRSKWVASYVEWTLYKPLQTTILWDLLDVQTM